MVKIPEVVKGEIFDINVHISASYILPTRGESTDTFTRVYGRRQRRI